MPLALAGCAYLDRCSLSHSREPPRAPEALFCLLLMSRWLSSQTLSGSRLRSPGALLEMPQACENSACVFRSDAWEDGTIDLIRALNFESSDLGIGEFLGGSLTESQSWWSGLGRLAEGHSPIKERIATARICRPLLAERPSFYSTSRQRSTRPGDLCSVLCSSTAGSRGHGPMVCVFSP